MEKKFLKYFSVAAMIAVVLSANAALADFLIKDLPDKGPVAVSGIVSEIKDTNTFTLKDTEGKTVKVASNNAINLTRGDNVRVEGEVQSTALGFGREIVASNITRYDASMNNSGSNSGSPNAAGSGSMNNSGAGSGAGSNYDNTGSGSGSTTDRTTGVN